MKLYEAQIICENIQFADRSHWDNTRLLAYIYTLANSKKGTKLTPEDILRFPWDRVQDKKKGIGMTDEEFNRLNEIAKTFKNKQ
jgi:hypothetical protein